MLSELRALAATIAQTDAAALGDDVVEAVRLRAFDNLGTLALGAALTPEGAAALRAEALVALPAPSAVDALRTRVAACRCTELDDIHAASCTTVGSVIVPTAAVLASRRWGAGADDRALVAAVACGYEAMLRVAESVDGAALVYAGSWTTYLCAPAGAAAVAARLLGLDADRTAAALAIAIALARRAAPESAGTPSPRWLAVGEAAADGVLAAAAAAAGAVAPELDGTVAGLPCDASILAADGERWRVQEVDTKPWPTARQVMSSVAALREALGARPAAEIAAIEVALPAQYRPMIDTAERLPGGRLKSVASLQYQLALAATDPTAFADLARAPLPLGAEIERLVGAVRVDVDDALTACYPRTWPARVTLRLRDGAEATAEVHDPRGSWRDPFALADVRAKLLAADAARAMPPGWADALLDACSSLGDGARAATLIDTLPAAGLPAEPR